MRIYLSLSFDALNKPIHKIVSILLSSSQVFSNTYRSIYNI